MFKLIIKRNEIPNKQTLESIIGRFKNFLIVNEKYDSYIYVFESLDKANEVAEYLTDYGFKFDTDFSDSIVSR